MSTGFKYVRVLFIVVALAFCGDSGPAEAGVWDTVKEWYASFRLGEVDEARIPETPVASFRSSIPWRDITAWKDRLYIWRPPSEEAAETSNGTVEVYKLFFDIK